MTDRNDDKHDDELLDDVDKWEKRELGADPEFARRAKGGRRQEIDEKLGLKKIRIRLATETVQKLEQLAEDEGLILRALVRRILEEHVDNSISCQAGS